jgi:hypothetical protein
LVIKALDPDWIRIRNGIQPKMVDPDEMNADPQPPANVDILCCLHVNVCLLACVCGGQSEEQGEGHATAVVHGQEDAGGRAGRARTGYRHQENGEHMENGEGTQT